MTKTKKWDNVPLYIMLIPAFIILIIFAYIPMVGIVIAFQDFIPSFGFLSFRQKFIGFENFNYAFTLPGFWNVVLNTLGIALGKIALGTIGAIGLSLLLNEVPLNKFRKGIQTIIYIPHFISWVILAGVFREILDVESGLVNRVIVSLGGKSVNFFGEAKIYPWVLILTDVWKELGFSTIVYLSAISTISPELYDAAKIDGANRLQIIRYVTLPGMKYIIILNLFLSAGNIFNAGFDQIFNTYNSQVMKTGDVLDTLIYRLGLEQRSYGVSTAVSVAKSTITGGLMGLFYFIAYKFLDYKVF